MRVQRVIFLDYVDLVEHHSTLIRLVLMGRARLTFPWGDTLHPDTHRSIFGKVNYLL